MNQYIFNTNCNSKPIITQYDSNGCEIIISHKSMIDKGTVWERPLLTNPVTKKKEAAARIFWEYLEGVIPNGLQVLHKPILCHNSKCININHLYLGIQEDNSRDRQLDNTSNKGLVHSDKAKNKMSQSHKGQKGYWKGKKLTNQHRENISKGMKGVSYA